MLGLLHALQAGKLSLSEVRRSKANVKQVLLPILFDLGGAPAKCGQPPSHSAAVARRGGNAHMEPLLAGDFVFGRVSARHSSSFFVERRRELRKSRTPLTAKLHIFLAGSTGLGSACRYEQSAWQLCRWPTELSVARIHASRLAFEGCVCV